MIDTKEFRAEPYDLATTLTSGQTFRWRRVASGWDGVIGSRWVRVSQTSQGIRAAALGPISDWTWVEDYFQVGQPPPDLVGAFPSDKTLRAAVKACHGLRLLRQEPWECLASFVLSSCKQVVQIQRVIGLLCSRLGPKVATPAGVGAAVAFPSPECVARSSETQLRACGMGFRAPYLLASARAVAEGRCDLKAVGSLPLDTARQVLMQLPGVGRKIADCVLLFAFGFQQAFPIDVWIERALRDFYFAGEPVPARQLLQFAGTRFGACGGWVQQYLYHYARIKIRNREAHA